MNKFKPGDRVVLTSNLHGTRSYTRGSVGTVQNVTLGNEVIVSVLFDNYVLPCNVPTCILNYSGPVAVVKEEKPTNPKDAVGIKKVPMSVLPANVLGQVALGCAEGALKYGRHNYREMGVRTSVYYDATMRHLMAYWEGQDIDPDSGLPHVIKAISSLVVLADAIMNDKVTDDRPPRIKNYDTWVQEQNKKMEELLNKYPEPKEAYVERS